MIHSPFGRVFTAWDLQLSKIGAAFLSFGSLIFFSPNSTLIAEEVGTYALVFGPEGIGNLGNYSVGSGSQSNAGEGWKSYGIADFHALAVAGSASTGSERFGQRWVGGGAYWQQQMTISSPSMPPGTQGVVDFTLFFEGVLEAKLDGNQTPYSSSISYRWDVGPVPDAPDYSQSGSESRGLLAGFNGYQDLTGPDFLNSPRTHSIVFEYGKPFTFKLELKSSSKPWTNYPCKCRVELRSKGWNGFKNFRIRYTDVPVTDAVVSSTSGFNYANSSTTTYSQWASLYQLDAASMNLDTNRNGLINLLEYALGRDPVSPSKGSALNSNLVTMDGVTYPCFTFTRPKLGGRPGDITYLPQRSNGLSGWVKTGLETTVAPSDTSMETVTVRSTQSVSTGNAQFMRLEVTEP